MTVKKKIKQKSRDEKQTKCRLGTWPAEKHKENFTKV